MSIGAFVRRLVLAFQGVFALSERFGALLLLLSSLPTTSALYYHLFTVCLFRALINTLGCVGVFKLLLLLLLLSSSS